MYSTGPDMLHLKMLKVDVIVEPLSPVFKWLNEEYFLLFSTDETHSEC